MESDQFRFAASMKQTPGMAPDYIVRLGDAVHVFTITDQGDGPDVATIRHSVLNLLVGKHQAQGSSGDFQMLFEDSALHSLSPTGVYRPEPAEDCLSSIKGVFESVSLVNYDVRRLTDRLGLYLSQPG